MSTAGSRPAEGAAPAAYTPDAARPADGAPGPAPTPGPAKPRARVRIVRWQGAIGLVAILALAWLGVWLFGERVVRATVAEAATKALGTQVDIAAVDIDVGGTSVEITGLAIADPFDPMRNLVELPRTKVVLEGRPLLEKKVVVRSLAIDSIRAGTRRATAARRVAGGGFAPRVMRELQAWRSQFNVPLLSFTPIDTIRSLVLDPSQLGTVQAAKALAERADSTQRDLVGRIERLPVQATVDSAQALAARLRGQTPLTLGIAGTRTAIADLRRLHARVDSMRRAVEAMPALIRAGADTLGRGLRALDDARRADYAFARGLLKLPTVDAPNIGPALFGAVSIDAFERALYWASVAQEHAPPGLRPKPSEGPKRARLAGTTVRFAAPSGLPDFLVRNAQVTASLGDAVGAVRGEYTIRVANLTSQPAVLGRPMQFSLRRRTASDSLVAVGAMDHAGAAARDWVEIRAGGIGLPGFAVPSLPMRAELGRGASTLRLRINGDGIDGRWQVDAPAVAWTRTDARTLNTVESLVARVLERVPSVSMTSEIGGTRTKPTLAVRSNLDVAVANAMRSVLGEEVARAERRVREQVDAHVERAVQPVRERVTTLRADAERRVTDAQVKLDAAKEELAARLRALGAGVIPGQG